MRTTSGVRRSSIVLDAPIRARSVALDIDC